MRNQITTKSWKVETLNFYIFNFKFIAQSLQQNKNATKELG